MELKLEHLAPYLPYGLECIWINRLAFQMTDGELPVKEVVEELTIKNYVQLLEGHKAIPILHPLSDLTKEIEHKGDRFKPIESITYPYTEKWEQSFYEAWKLDISTGYLSYQNWNKLVSWHFDVFGLIEQGLALDINKLKQ